MVAGFRQGRVCMHADLGVAYWTGPVGSGHEIVVDEIPVPPSQIPMVNIVVSGRMKMLRPDGSLAWTYGEGDSSKLRGTFDQKGIWRWTVAEENTVELCISVIGPDRKETTERMDHRDFIDGKITVAGDSLAVVSKGAFETPKGVFHAPHVVRVTQPTVFEAMEPDSRLSVVRRLS
jgi:hypothetical protein